jgi:arylsulfatase A-like enzyme
VSDRKPHVVLFNPDQWRGDALGHMGHPAAQTPVLDAWVESDAVSFGNAYCQNPVCTPSRCSFMTGWYPHVRGHRTMFHMLQPDEPCLLRTLKREGYFVWWGGKNDLVPAQNGYDEYCDVKYVPEDPPRPRWAMDRADEWRGDPGSDSYYSFQVGKLEAGDDGFYRDSDWAHVQGAIDLIRSYDGDQPLCIYLPLSYPHPPYAVEDPWFSAIDRLELPERIPAPDDWTGKPSLLARIHERQGLSGWSEDRWDELRVTYLGMCARVDHQFGLVLDALREAGMYDDTAVFLFSDHGDFTGDYGLVEKTQNTFEDCLTRVPLIVKPPASLPVNPRVTDALVELIDIPATVEAICGIEPQHSHFGRSLLPLIAGETEVGRDAVFCEGGRLRDEVHACESDSLTELGTTSLYWPRVVTQVEDDVAHTKAVMCRTVDFKYVHRLYESDELYDLRNDPGEQRNVVGKSENAATLATLRERTMTHLLETGDVVPFARDSRG